MQYTQVFSMEPFIQPPDRGNFHSFRIEPKLSGLRFRVFAWLLILLTPGSRLTLVLWGKKPGTELGLVPHTLPLNQTRLLLARVQSKPFAITQAEHGRRLPPIHLKADGIWEGSCPG